MASRSSELLGLALLRAGGGGSWAIAAVLPRGAGAYAARPGDDWMLSSTLAGSLALHAHLTALLQWDAERSVTSACKHIPLAVSSTATSSSSGDARQIYELTAVLYNNKGITKNSGSIKVMQKMRARREKRV